MAGKGKRGPHRKLDVPRIDRIYGHMREGHGRYRACQLEDVSYVTLRKRFQEDASILEQLVCIEKARAEDCLEVAYSLRKHANPEICLTAVNVYLSQSPKLLEARRAIAAQKQSKAENQVLAGLLGKIADVVFDLVIPERRQELIRRPEVLEREIDAA
ncbi:MAG: hypothetical protein JWN86_228 [Planctomycetota bacterium]|nr:hypothetical protein [Planctomycetota bacterium]